MHKQITGFYVEFSLLTAETFNEIEFRTEQLVTIKKLSTI